MNDRGGAGYLQRGANVLSSLTGVWSCRVLRSAVANSAAGMVLMRDGRRPLLGLRRTIAQRLLRYQ